MAVTCALTGCRACGKYAPPVVADASLIDAGPALLDAAAEAAVSADASMPVDAAADATAEVSIDAKPYRELPPNPSLGGFAGFTADDRYLGYEIETCEVCSAEFHFLSPTEPPLELAYAATTGEDYDEEKVKRHDAAITRRIVAMGVAQVKDGRKLRGPFPVDLLFATKKTRDVARGTVTLHFGARVRGGKPVYPMRVVLGPHPMFVHAKTETMDDPVLVYANVTKDGREIGVVATARGTAWHEQGGVARMTVEAFAAEVRGAAP